MSGDPYEILGVAEEATQEELNDVKKKLAKKLHPDKNPNDPNAAEKFQDMMAAYELLSSPARRDRYNKTGQWDPQKSFEKRFTEIIQAVFVKIAEDIESPKHVNPVLLFKDHVRNVFATGLKNQEDLDKKIKKLNEVRKRINYDGDEENLLAKTLDLQLSQYEIGRHEYREELELVKKIQEVLEYYEYDIDNIKRIDTRSGFGLDGLGSFTFQ